MSTYFVKGSGWRYDFQMKKKRYTEQWFKTKKYAIAAEARKREELKYQNQIQSNEQMMIDTTFLTLVNERLDYLKDYTTEKYYDDVRYRAIYWVSLWGAKLCIEISEEMIRNFLRKRKEVSAHTANAEIRSLNALFNHGINNKIITHNPVANIKFFPVEKKIKYVPSLEDIDKVISQADEEAQDYLWVIRETLGRMSEANNLEWDDTNFNTRSLILYTRKKKDGNLTPRKIPMSNKLYEVLYRRYKNRDKSKPWVFWHRYWSTKEKKFIEGPYKARKKLMKSLCKKAEVRYFRYHPIRHSGASTMDLVNVPIGSIQRILGHESRITTELYLHSIGEPERDAIKKLEQAREKSHTKSHTEKEEA